MQSGTRLTFSNLYALYPNLGHSIKSVINPYPGRGLLQNDFGKAQDCTLTSMAYIFGPEHYNLIESVAKRYGYNGDRWGTFSITIRKIMQTVMNRIGGEYQFKKAKSAYLKNIGVKWELCKKLSHQNMPFYILNISNDGRNYYKNHSVTVIGYKEYQNARFLVVYDNWFKTSALIDFDKLSIFCSINWIE